MRQIEFTANLAGQELKVTLKDPLANGGHWQVLIGHFYHGTISRREGKWIGHLNPKSNLQADDIQILGTLIDQQCPD